MNDWASRMAMQLLSRMSTSDVTLDQRDYIAAALREARAMGPEWQPIETAKKDGSWMLLAKIVGHPDHPTALWWVCRGHWSARWNNWNDGIEPCGLAGPTHYLLADGHGVRQPLPAPPKES